MAIDHADYLPSLRQDSKTTQTWVSGNTFTITDSHIKASSTIIPIHTSAWVGNWYQTVSAGSVTFTSSDAESNATFKYLIT